MANERSLAGQLLSFLGLSGAGMPTDTIAPRANNPAGAEKLYSGFLKNTEVGNPNVWNAYNSSMQRPGSFDEMLRLWDEMASWDLLSTAIQELVDEVTQTDQFTQRTVWYECNDRRVETDLNKMADDIEIEDFVTSQVWYETAMGNSFNKLHYEPGRGILGMTWCHPMDVRRYWLARNRRCLGFRWTAEKPEREDLYQQGGQQVPRVSIGDASRAEDLWYPWDFCFTGDTKISLLDGREVSLEQLHQEVGEGEFWVYSSSQTGRVVPGKAHSLKLTRKDTPVVEVELDNGEKVRCTPDHKFMLRDGTYKEAGKLEPGESLMPLYRRLTNKEEHKREGYEQFLDNNTGKWMFTHWRVAASVHGTPGRQGFKVVKNYHVHHKTFNKRNNDPRELEWLTVAEHHKVHNALNTDPAFKEHCRAARSASMKRTWATKRGLMMKAIKATTSSPKFKKSARANALALRDRMRADPEFAKKVREATRSAKLASGTYHNHKVVSVKPAGVSDVYDFEVDGHHNFALSAGVFVHNCHIRRMYKMRVSEHGEPIFNEVQGIYKKLRMALDQMLVYRAQVQPDRYVFKIDTQEQPPIEQMKTIARWKQQFRNKIAFGGGGGENSYGAPTGFKSYYDAQALDTILWMANPKGFSHAVEKMAGTTSVPDIYDIELLTNLFFSAMRMPKSWLGIGDQTNGPSSGKALLAQDMRFLRAAKSIRKPLQASYTWLGYLHCVLKGVDVQSLNIQAKMSDISSLEDQLRLEMLGKQMELLNTIGDVLDKFHIPREAMVELMFKKYMRLPDDVVNAVLTALPPENDQQESKSLPSSRAMLGMFEDKVRDTPEAQRLLFELKQLNKYGPRRIEPPTGHALIKGFSLPTEAITIKPRDVVVSSYGEIQGLTSALLDPAKSTINTGKGSLQESAPGYRRWAPV